MKRGASTIFRCKEKDLEMIEVGRGQGILADYQPWLYVHQERGDCTSLRFYLPLTGRTHQLLTRKNIQCFMELIFDDTVTDIREYYALLPRDETIEMAEAAGIKFPRYSESHDKKVLTFDFVVSRGDEVTAVVVHTGKTLNDITERRIFQIQQLYCNKHGWKLQVEYKENMSAQRANNIRRIMMPSPWGPEEYGAEAREEFLEMYFQSDLSIREIAGKVEANNGLEKGMGIHLFRTLMREKQILLNLDAGPMIYSTKGEIRWRRL